MSARDAQRALAMIERARAKGRASECKIVRPGTPGEYNPETGKVEGGSDPVTHTAHGVKDGYAQRDIDGTIVRQGDQRVYIPALGFIRPLTTEKLNVDGKDYSIVSVSVIAPGAVDALYVVQIRGV
ncbi:hypothetical protein [Alcaligenes faecalis]|uniref:hypothetical protein n=1 Tax=Alcaligenes faecalis TaxID=511 RepID=UPI000694E109|nr:hypothetical protein [Alcaligenes faecalis]ATH99538.1 hypothetical protein CPY64_07255 [Alcaligenes faecalis]AYZ92325.1 hypothetical protein EGY22_13025 [Alcaligenes faecalis]MCX5593061.1 hypothetical protein [Alcaligenes faecalis]QQC31875.1 hypothetical protein I6H81_14655 [Alcaligenes faecalis]CAJ0903280.1 Phage protein [Alcaligenes faecalis subsp. faecalis]